MRRFMVLVTVVLLMMAMLVATLTPAFAVTLEPDDGNPRGPKWGVPVTTSACSTVAGVAGFEWRAGGEVCWLNLPVRLP
jgi:hypothetical protein